MKLAINERPRHHRYRRKHWSKPRPRRMRRLGAWLWREIKQDARRFGWMALGSFGTVAAVIVFLWVGE